MLHEMIPINITANDQILSPCNQIISQQMTADLWLISPPEGSSFTTWRLGWLSKGGGWNQHSKSLLSGVSSCFSLSSFKLDSQLVAVVNSGGL